MREACYCGRTETFRWVGSRFSGGSMTCDLEVACAGEDLAYTVGYERDEVVDGGEKRLRARRREPALTSVIIPVNIKEIRQ